MKPTEKQLDYIRKIEEHSIFPIKFTGTTKEEASEWIRENVNSAYKSDWAITNGYD